MLRQITEEQLISMLENSSGSEVGKKVKIQRRKYGIDDDDDDDDEDMR